jgi:hypothetical protein
MNTCAYQSAQDTRFDTLAAFVDEQGFAWHKNPYVTNHTGMPAYTILKEGVEQTNVVVGENGKVKYQNWDLERLIDMTGAF